jgi:hypothetical protein
MTVQGSKVTVRGFFEFLPNKYDTIVVRNLNRRWYFFMKSISDEITSILIQSGAVSENERKMYDYCVNGVLEIAKNLVGTLATSR